jgi:hypothetical protein
VDVNGSYFYNSLDNQVDQKINRQYLIPGNNFTSMQDSHTGILNENHRFNFMSDYKIDSMNSLKYITSANVQQSETNNHSQFSSIAPKGFLLNDGYSSTNTHSNGYTWDNNLLWRHKFQKKGRTFSSSLSYTAGDAKSKSLLNSLTRFYEPDGLLNAADTIDQVNKQNLNSHVYGAILSYTEPLSRKSLLEFNYNFNQNNSSSGRETYDLNHVTGEDPVKNELLSNDFDNRYQAHKEGISWRYQDKKYNIAVGNFIQAASMRTDFHFLGFDSSLNKQFLNYLPSARIEYVINKFRNLQFQYNTSTRAPSANQLNPIVDLSDPLNIRVGNPNLSQEYTHRLTMHYMSFDPFRRTSFFSMLNFSATNKRIVSYDRIDSQGVRKTSYINVDGVYNLIGVANWGLPIKPIKSSLNLSTNIVHSKNINFINTAENIINSWNITQEANLNFVHKELLDLTAGANVSYNRVRYSLPGQQNANYWNQEYSLDMNIYLPHGFSVASEFTFTQNTGYSNGYNADVALWNAGLAKQLFKNKKGEIKAQIFDILNQNVGISRNANQNYIEDVATKILNRYFLLSFTYNLSRFAGKSAPKMEQGNIKIVGERARM